MRPVAEVRAIVGVGLQGDRYAVGAGHWSEHPSATRDITFVEAEVLEALRDENGIDLAPGATRRNVTTRGIRLNELVGQRFQVGPVICEGIRLCEPCSYLSGLVGRPVHEMLVHRGGLRAHVVSEGVIRVGDQVRPA